MITKRNFNASLLTFLAITATIIGGYHFNRGSSTQTSAIPSVFITVERMTQEQKVAYDLAQNAAAIQTVVIEGKRLNTMNNEQNLANNQVDSKILHHETKNNKKLSLII